MTKEKYIAKDSVVNLISLGFYSNAYVTCS